MSEPAHDTPVEFDVWGCRGSRNIIPTRSRVGNNTACYSVLRGSDLIVFDAGRGLLVLGHTMNVQARFAGVRRIHVLVTHAHVDHWEGLKDAEWFWRRDNGLEVSVWGTEEAIATIHQGFSHPSYIPLEVLAEGTVSSLRFQSLAAGDERDLGGWTLRTFPLNHYSGGGSLGRNYLSTIGYRLTSEAGASIAYLSDHEPTEATREVEERAVGGAHLAFFDAHFADYAEQRFGHGSQEHAANVARAHSKTLVLCGHHGPMYSDRELRANFRRHGRGVTNLALAVEGHRYGWNGRGFDPKPKARETAPQPLNELNP